MWVIRSDLIVLKIVPTFNKVIFLQGVQPSHVGDHSPRERKTRSKTDTGKQSHCVYCLHYWLLCDDYHFVKEVGDPIKGFEEFDPLENLLPSQVGALSSPLVWPLLSHLTLPLAMLYRWT